MVNKIFQGRFQTKNGYASIATEYDGVLSVFMIKAIEPHKGYGTKLVIELEEFAKQNGFEELEFIEVGNPILARILHKRYYRTTTEFKDIAGCEVEIYYRAFS